MIVDNLNSQNLVHILQILQTWLQSNQEVRGSRIKT